MLTLSRGQAVTIDDHTYVDLISILVQQDTSYHLLPGSHRPHREPHCSIPELAINISAFSPLFNTYSLHHYGSWIRGVLVLPSHLTKSLPQKIKIYDHNNTDLDRIVSRERRSSVLLYL
jgi:hypothetical protein